MRSMEAKITGFEKVVGQNLERRLLDLEHVMATLNERIDTQTQIHEEEVEGEEGEEVTGAGGMRRESSGSVESSGGSGGGSMSGSGGSSGSAASSFYEGGVEEMKGGEVYRVPMQQREEVVGV